MFEGPYSFFDYKYNIPNYHGQDYDGIMRWVYLIFSAVTIIALIILLRNAKHSRIDKYLKIMAFVMIALEITKVTWESYWDVTTGRGLNFEGILPLDTCSIFLYVLPFAAFSKGKLKRIALDWLATLGFVAGMSNLLFIQGLKWYPFWTFGAFFSMFYHYMMVFTALLLVVTRYARLEFKDAFYGFLPQLAFAVIVIPLDLIFKWDYMLYRSAGGVPVIESVAEKLSADGLNFLTPVLMLFIYFAMCALFTALFGIGQKALDYRKNPVTDKLTV